MISANFLNNDAPLSRSECLKNNFTVQCILTYYLNNKTEEEHTSFQAATHVDKP